MVSSEEILESQLAVLCRCGVLPYRVHNLLWRWNVRTLRDFVKFVHEFDYWLPFLHSAAAKAELQEARKCVFHAIRLTRNMEWQPNYAWQDTNLPVSNPF